MTKSRQDTSQSRDYDLQALSEAQLRQLYDGEEAERFMSLFSTYVAEVRLPTDVSAARSTGSRLEDSINAATGRPSIPPLPRHPTHRSLSERIAYTYLLPHLPPAPGVTPAFTLKRLSLTAQRLYLAMFPPHHAFLSDLARLALWKDHQRSLRYCLTFWFLWFHDLLLPALVFWITFHLLRRRLSTYPTRKELQERRQQTVRALEFGEAVQQHLSVSTLGPIELWRLFKLYKSNEKSKAKPVSKDEIETNEEECFKQNILRALNELADLHERVKNIFTWRRPDVSRRYLFFLIVIGFGTLILPAQYIAKLVYCVGGILYWHVTPVVAALPRDRTRVPLLFRDAPTDADYAMELITKRIATGRDAGMSSPSNRPCHASNTPTSMDNFTPTLCATSREVLLAEDDCINWRKWSERVARGKWFLEEGKQFLSTSTSRDRASGETTIVRHVGSDAYTFLAQYASSPGLITLTPSALFFTSLTGSHARLIIRRDRLRGVRRSGIMKGISITWAPDELVDGEEREERFHWVGNRDELFARLVGSDGGRWITV